MIERLEPEFDITGYFYNPNIEPPEEYQRRLEATQTIFNYLHMKLIISNNDNTLWHEAINGLEHWEEGGRRCWRCFEFRLEQTAEQAKKQSIQYFATTLTASPHKNDKDINGLGKKIGKQYGLNFIALKYRPEDRNKASLARKLELYHQKYCGCMYSARI
jgi:predicted adenine nucleotide alpha hydrolase (AANH) superfamily ATPase